MRVMTIHATAVLVLILTSGCGQPISSAPPAEESPDEAEPGQPDPAASPTHEPPGEAEYTCFGPPIPASAWAAQEPAGDVEHPGRQVLLEDIGSDGLDGWFLLQATDERLAVARERDVTRERGDDMLRTHDVVAVRDFGGEHGWQMEQWSSCTPQLVHDDAGPAEVWLDGEPKPDDLEVDLLVMEIACASGESAEGRIEVVKLDEREDAVEVAVGVRPRGGDATCPSNPATPFTIELQRPLEDRMLIDGSVYPPRPLDIAPGTQHEG